MWKLTKQGPWLILNLLRVDQCLGRLVPGASWVGSDTRCLFGTSINSHSITQADWASESAGWGGVLPNWLSGRETKSGWVEVNCLDWWVGMFASFCIAEVENAGKCFCSIGPGLHWAPAPMRQSHTTNNGVSDDVFFKGGTVLHMMITCSEKIWCFDFSLQQKVSNLGLECQIFTVIYWVGTACIVGNVGLWWC